MEISPETNTNPKADVFATPIIAGLVVKWCEKSKAGKKQAKAPWGSYFLSIISKEVRRLQLRRCLEGSDEIHEEILTSVTTNHQGQHHPHRLLQPPHSHGSYQQELKKPYEM
ncbi:hypothetical protein Rs2_16631 [Raphanus sativus]|nr:hypothetical protein Rs2_16631 [Raphanus sativus]